MFECPLWKLPSDRPTASKLFPPFTGRSVLPFGLGVGCSSRPKRLALSLDSAGLDECRLRSQATSRDNLSILPSPAGAYIQYLCTFLARDIGSVLWPIRSTALSILAGLAWPGVEISGELKSIGDVSRLIARIFCIARANTSKGPHLINELWR